MKMLDLRYYQQEAVNAVYLHLQEKPESNPCVVIPTGGGKSIVIARIASDAVKLWGGRVLILAHVKELLEQNASKIQMLCPDLKIGMYSAGLGRRDTEERVVVAGIQSVYSKAAELGKFDLILVDEAHSIPQEGEGRYQTLLKEEQRINSNVRLIGFTATPYRLSGGLICKPGNLLNEICYDVSVRELILRGYLSKLRSKNGRTKPEFDDLHIRAGEFVADEVAAKMDNEGLVFSACSEIVRASQDRKAVLIFASSVAHAKHIREQIELQSGEECGIVLGDTPKAERAEILERFKGHAVVADLFGNRKPALKYLVNVGVLTTGFDAPRTDAVALLRPTASPGLYYQMVGRGFRLSPETGKTDALVLDYGGNIMRHGPVDMIRVDETPAGRKKQPPPMRECPECMAVFPAGRTKCPDCGFEMPREEGKLHHSGRAASDGILSGETVTTEFEVRGVRYGKHYKRNAPDKPPTLQVEYQIGFNDYISDWVCPEHTGYARSKAKKWWTERAGFDLPATVDECLIYAEAGKLREPRAVTVTKVAGAAYPRITKYEFREAEAANPEIPEETAELHAERRLFKLRAEAETEEMINLDAEPDEIEERLAIMNE